MANSQTDWGEILATLGVFACFYIVHYAYFRVKRRFCEVTASTAGTAAVFQDEKSPLLTLTDEKDGADVEGQHVTIAPPTARPWPLILWTLLAFPLNCAVCYVLYHEWHIGDSDVELGKLTRKEILDILIAVLSFLPAFATLHVFGLALAVRRARSPEKAEKRRLMMRVSMLDCIILPLLLVLLVFYAYPEKITEGGSCLWIVAAAYVSQKVAWKRFFRLSKRESEAAL
ncbi:hypothetical protein AURDEDRAFT_171607 [Auricularia subglabra TFB-10046 SS5]|nr:hypothetical protein AURDEDRAFT_171607 [Auricularia subglabra TFB-10046 SS5]